jgi:K+-sensing histidine kinase KdpD
LRGAFSVSRLRARTRFPGVCEYSNALVSAINGRAPQIVMNAVSNAMKYTPAGAHDGIAITARLDAPGLVVEVTDCGPGLRGLTLAQLVTEFGGIGSESARQGVIRSSGMGGHTNLRGVM